MNEQEVLYRPFDIEVHKKTFINYLEVIIEENGTIMYAIPSHQEKIIFLACEKLDISREELEKRCPKEYYGDYMNWLCQQARCIAVWNEFSAGVPNEIQKEALRKLAEEKLYRGII